MGKRHLWGYAGIVTKPQTTQEITQAALKKVGTTYALAKLVGVRWQTAQRWRDGVTEPRGKNLLKLLELAGKSLSILVCVSLLFAATSTPSHAAQSSSYKLLYIMSNYIRRIRRRMANWFAWPITTRLCAAHE